MVAGGQHRFRWWIFTIVIRSGAVTEFVNLWSANPVGCDVCKHTAIVLDISSQNEVFVIWSYHEWDLAQNMPNEIATDNQEPRDLYV